MTIEVLAQFSHGKAAGSPVDQSHAGAPFQLCDPFAQGLLGRAKGATGRRVSSVIHHLDEDLQIIEVQCHVVPNWRR